MFQQYQGKHYYYQCSGSGSIWIRIEIAPLDPDLYWEYVFRIRIQDSQKVVLYRKN